MKTEMKNIPLTYRLEHAPWNPREKADLAADNASMIELIASIRHAGVIEPIVLWHTNGGECEGVKGPAYIVIAGNRRLAAARAAELEEIPAVVRTGLTELQAREITRIENEVRLGIDPMKDAEQIGKMLELGYEQKEIAARFGVSEAMVCRRVKLLSLHPEVIKELDAKGVKIATNALERIATQFPPDLQLAGVKSFIKRDLTFYRNNNGQDVVCEWKALQRAFSELSFDLDVAPGFDSKSICANCPHRTGAQGDLFGDLGDGKLGSCLAKECYEMQKYNALRDNVRKLAKADEKTELVDLVAVALPLPGDKRLGLSDWLMPEALKPLFGDRRSKKRTVVYFEKNSWESNPRFLWGPSKDDLGVALARVKEDYEADQRNKAARHALEEKVSEERKKLENAIEDLETEIDGKIGVIDKDAIKNAVIKSKKFAKNFDEQCEGILAKLLAEFIRDDYSEFSLDERLAIVRGLGLMKFFSIDEAAWKALDGAREDLDDFELEHGLKDSQK